MSSQEQRPIRSRRELRRAREQNPEVQAEPTVPQEPAAPQETEPAGGAERSNGRNRRAADVPVDAVGAAAQERSSQIRARDRAALRTIKELADKEEQLSGGGPPTRRQLRLQQLQAEVATSMNPIVPMPGAKPKAADKDGEKQQTPDGPRESAQPKKPAPSGSPNGPAAESEMSVEQALAVRELIAAQVQNQTSKLEHIAEQDPLAVDPEVLAQQIALAERAAVLNKRAAAKQKLAEQNQSGQKQPAQNQPAQNLSGPNQPGEGKPPSTSAGPSTANNLAMVTPLEFVKVPGVERPVMKRPSTTFVPLVTSTWACRGSCPRRGGCQVTQEQSCPHGGTKRGNTTASCVGQYRIWTGPPGRQYSRPGQGPAEPLAAIRRPGTGPGGPDRRHHHDYQRIVPPQTAHAIPRPRAITRSPLVCT